MTETEELLHLGARACVAMFSAAAAFELRMTRNGVLALSGEPLADLNMLLIGSDPDAAAFLKESMARVSERGLPLLAMFSSELTSELAPAAERSGLMAAGAAPLMVLRADKPVRPSRPCDIRRVLGPGLVGVAGDLVSAAFSLPREAVADLSAWVLGESTQAHA